MHQLFKLKYLALLLPLLALAAGCSSSDTKASSNQAAASKVEGVKYKLTVTRGTVHVELDGKGQHSSDGGKAEVFFGEKKQEAKKSGEYTVEGAAAFSFEDASGTLEIGSKGKVAFHGSGSIEIDDEGCVTVDKFASYRISNLQHVKVQEWAEAFCFQCKKVEAEEHSVVYAEKCVLATANHDSRLYANACHTVAALDFSVVKAADTEWNRVLHDAVLYTKGAKLVEVLDSALADVSKCALVKGEAKAKIKADEESKLELKDQASRVDKLPPRVTSN